jgi:hypothetical protein
MQGKKKAPMGRDYQGLGKEWLQPILMMEQEENALVSTPESDIQGRVVDTRCDRTMDMFEHEE